MATYEVVALHIVGEIWIPNNYELGTLGIGRLIIKLFPDPRSIAITHEDHITN